MPFRGELDGEPVLPHGVDVGDAVVCPDCEKRMTVVGSHTRRGALVARHFRHDGDGGGCGESDEHMRMKYTAASAMKSIWGDADVEVESDVPSAGRRADVVAFFGADVRPLGKGVAVEVQYRNDSKDMERVAEDYRDAGFSCLELGTDAFDGHRVSITLRKATTAHMIHSSEEDAALTSKLRWLSQGEVIEQDEMQERLGWSDEWASFRFRGMRKVPRGKAVFEDGIIRMTK